MRDLLLERIYQQVPDNVYEDILDLTRASGKHANAITKWFCKMYLNGHFPSFDESMYDDAADLYFGYLRYKSKLKPIMDYETPDDLLDDIYRIQISGYKSRSDLDRIAREGSKQIYKDNDFIILKINTYAASRKYGNGTKWCISTRLYPSVFEDYNNNDDTYFVIDRKRKECKYACIGRVCWDEWDEVIFFIPRKNEDGTEENMDEFFTSSNSAPVELYERIKDHPELYDVLPKAFPNIPEQEVKRAMDKVIDYAENPQKYIDKK